VISSRASIAATALIQRRGEMIPDCFCTVESRGNAGGLTTHSRAPLINKSENIRRTRRRHLPATTAES